MVFRAVCFTFIPTFIELILVCGLLAKIFQPLLAILVVATFATYVVWTAKLTQAAAQVCLPASLPGLHVPAIRVLHHRVQIACMWGSLLILFLNIA